MPSAAEAAGVGTPMQAVLDAGLDTLSYNQTITFTKYVRRILPADGFLFWLKATPTAERTVKGSFHFATDQRQAEDETFGVNRVVFTSEAPIDDFNTIEPGCMWIGCFEGLRFSFAGRKSFYRQAGIHHYVGEAIYPAFATQIIDSAADLDLARVVVSNSLPIWLTLNKLMPLYPSFLVAENIEPMWCAVHIPPEGTVALQPTPVIVRDSSHYQLASDRVRLTFYGARNDTIMDFVDDAISFMTDSDVLGLMGGPIVRDDKRVQREMNVLAQKKTVEFQVSYYQNRVRDLARQFITQALISQFYLQE